MNRDEIVEATPICTKFGKPLNEVVMPFFQHGGDVEALKEAEPWLFADAPKQSGKTGLPNAGTSSDEGKTLKRWRKLAGLDDSVDE